MSSSSASASPAPLPSPPARSRRIVYLGTPDLAVPPLRAIVDGGFEVPLVVSRPDARRGRGGSRQASPVKSAAVELGLAVTDRVDDVLDVGADLGVVVAYGQLIRLPVLQRVPLVNIHFSLLPRWRGAAPVERAILAGDATTGVALMAMEEGLDTGPVYASTAVDIDQEETLDELRQRLVEAGTALLVASLRDGFPTPEPQVGAPIYAHKIEAHELRIVWDRPADEVHRVIRLGRAWTTFRDKRLKVLRARRVTDDVTQLDPGELAGTQVGTSAGLLELIEVQPEGKAAQPAAAWSHGARLAAGERLGP